VIKKGRIAEPISGLVGCRIFQLIFSTIFGPFTDRVQIL